MAAPSPAPVAVLGAGPAGLTAASVLASRGCPGVVFEADTQVGGIAKTVEHDGFRFDLGGHRFFTKVAVGAGDVGADARGRVPPPPAPLPHLLPRLVLRVPACVPRTSSGVSASSRPPAAWARTLAARMRRTEPPQTFEDWVTGRFGRRLYDAFFREYTEKVWGIPGSEIQAEWAAQRIRNLSLWTALTSALRLKRRHVTSLIEEFHYPRLGPGQMWERIAADVEAQGLPVRLRHRVTRIVHDGRGVRAVEVVGPHGIAEVKEVDGVVSSIPLSELVLSLDPLPPDEVVAAAGRLRYRDLLVVGLVSTDPEPFPDNWIYLHDPGTRAGRVQNFGAWSPGMTHPGYTCLGAEYFCFRDDDLWSLPDHALVELAKRELAQIGLHRPRARRRRRRHPRSPGLPGVRPRVRAGRRHAPRPRRLDRRARDGRPQRAPPLQQPGSLHVDGGARHAQSPRRRRPRRLGGQRRERSTSRRESCRTRWRRTPSSPTSRSDREPGGDGGDRRQLVQDVQARARQPRRGGRGAGGGGRAGRG